MRSGQQGDYVMGLINKRLHMWVDSSTGLVNRGNLRQDNRKRGPIWIELRGRFVKDNRERGQIWTEFQKKFYRVSKEILPPSVRLSGAVRGIV